MKCINASFLVLAGGKSRRMGRDKACLMFEGKSLLERAIEGAKGLGVTEIYISGQAEGRYSPGGMEILRDEYLGCGPLAGIYAGLCRASEDRLMVVPCDVPFLNYSLFLEMALYTQGVSVVVPSDGTHLQPLVAIYTKNCIPFIRDMLDQGKCRIIDLYEMVPVAYFPVEKDEITFFNVNSPEDYERALRIDQGMKEVMFR